MKDEIEAILKKTLYCRPRLSGLAGSEYVYGIDKAAQAIADWIQSQPVDRVRAMAALVHPYTTANYQEYIVPDNKFVTTPRVVLWLSGPLKEQMICCYHRENVDDCEHVQAIKLYLRQNENNQR